MKRGRRHSNGAARVATEWLSDGHVVVGRLNGATDAKLATLPVVSSEGTDDGRGDDDGE